MYQTACNCLAHQQCEQAHTLFRAMCALQKYHSVFQCFPQTPALCVCYCTKALDGFGARFEVELRIAACASAAHGLGAGPLPCPRLSGRCCCRIWCRGNFAAVKPCCLGRSGRHPLCGARGRGCTDIPVGGIESCRVHHIVGGIGQVKTQIGALLGLFHHAAPR